MKTTPASIATSFLSSIGASTTTSTTTTSTTTMGNISVNGAKVANAAVSNITELETYALNGNKNILAIKGSLVIQGCASSTFVMQGVRTVIVE